MRIISPILISVILFTFILDAYAQPPTFGGGSKPALPSAGRAFDSKKHSSLMFTSHLSNMPYGFSIVGSKPGGVSTFWDIKFSSLAEITRSSDFTVEEFIFENNNRYYFVESLDSYLNTNFGLTIVVWDYIALYGGVGGSMKRTLLRFEDVNGEEVWIDDEEEGVEYLINVPYGIFGMWDPEFLSVKLIGRIGYETQPKGLNIGFGFAF